MWLLWACTGPGVKLETGDTAGTNETAETGETGETAETADTSGDADDDGFPVGADCDDANAAVYPGAPETWNGLDDDCDTYVDGQGPFYGDGRLRAVAIYKGERVELAGSCDSHLQREGNLLSFGWTCLAEKSDDRASFELLLGDVLTVTGEDGIGDLETTWAGDVEFVSSDGWDSQGEATLTWTSTRAVVVSIRLDAASLDVDGTATLDQGKQDPC